MVSLFGLNICYAYRLGTERESWVSCDHPGRCDLDSDCKTIPSVTVTRVNNTQGRTMYCSVFRKSLLEKMSHTLYKFVDDTEGGGIIDMPNGWASIQRGLEDRDNEKLGRFNPNILYVGWSKPVHRSRMGRALLKKRWGLWWPWRWTWSTSVLSL